MRRTFDGKPLRDATAPMLLPVLELDKAAAEAVRSKEVDAPARFKECLLAQCQMRVWGPDSKVRVMRRTVYVSLPGEKEALRYEMSRAAYEMVRNFDKKKPIKTGTIIELRPPAHSRQLGVMRKYGAKWKQAHPNYFRERKTTRKQSKTDPLAGIVRNGVYVKL